LLHAVRVRHRSHGVHLAGAQMSQQAIFSRRSLCPCGYPVLDERQPLGTEYQVFDMPGKRGWMICGGCGLKLNVWLVLVTREGTGPEIMPREIFAF